MSILVSAGASTARDLAASRLLPFACLLLCLIGSQTRAGQEVARIPIVDAPPKTPGLGAGVRLGNSPYRGDSTTFDLVPLYLYEGRYLFAHGVSAGVHA